MIRLLIAPDSFKDALAARQVCTALADGLSARRDLQLDLCPLADGGEGTAALLAGALRCDLVSESVHDPLHRPRTATWYHQPDSGLGLIEMAEASGLMLLANDERDPLRTSSFGTGELLAAACARGCRTIRICVGGSATVDGGAGCLQALGWTFWDDRRQPLPSPVTGGNLERIAGIAAPLEVPEAAVQVLCDVRNPLLGPDGAAAVFGPQKGATPAAVGQLDAGLRNLATLLAAGSGYDVSGLPGGGAAGGLPAGLAAALEADLCSGFEAVATAVELDRRIAAADVVLTGEGRLDAQSQHGKVVGQVAGRARAAGKPLVVIAGCATPAAGDSLDPYDLFTLSPEGPRPDALRETAARLTALGPRLLATLGRIQACG